MQQILKNPKTKKLEIANVFMSGGDPVGILFPDGTEIVHKSGVYKILKESQSLNRSANSRIKISLKYGAK